MKAPSYILQVERLKARDLFLPLLLCSLGLLCARDNDILICAVQTTTRGIAVDIAAGISNTSCLSVAVYTLQSWTSPLGQQLYSVH